MGFSLTSRAGVDGNAPYQAQELQITTLANPGIQTNFLPGMYKLFYSMMRITEQLQKIDQFRNS